MPSPSETNERMEAAAHTPGPWTLDGGVIRGVSAVTGKSRPIAEVYREFNTSSETYANASLIIAAPDLLAALEEMVAPYGKLTEAEIEYRHGYSAAERVSDARAAIAKARAS